MKIATLHAENQYCSWSMGAGLAATLRRMGYEVTDVVMPTSRQAPAGMIDRQKAEKPKIEALKAMDFIVVSGPEHILPWIEAVYGKEEWAKLDVPKAAWLHESCRREDYQIDIDTLRWTADHFFFPAIQDAEFHDQEPFLPGRSHWLPLGVDTDVFWPLVPNDGVTNKRFDVAFIGLMYPKRQVYVQSLARHQIPDIKVGGVAISDLHGFDAEGTARLLAKNYRQVKVFLNLPAMSNLLTSKVFEAMACGTFLLTPSLPEDGEKNMAAFTSGTHLVYYRPSNLAYLAQLLREWSSPEKDAERQKIAETGCREVHQFHSLQIRLHSMLNETLQVGDSVGSAAAKL